MPPRKTISGELIGELHKLKAKYKWDWKTIARKMDRTEEACKRSCESSKKSDISAPER